MSYKYSCNCISSVLVGGGSVADAGDAAAVESLVASPPLQFTLDDDGVGVMQLDPLVNSLLLVAFVPKILPMVFEVAIDAARTLSSDGSVEAHLEGDEGACIDDSVGSKAPLADVELPAPRRSRGAGTPHPGIDGVARLLERLGIRHLSGFLALLRLGPQTAADGVKATPARQHQTSRHLADR